MRDELRRCIELSQAFLALPAIARAGSLPSASTGVQHPIPNLTISPIRDTRIPTQLASRLLATTLEHFRASCATLYSQSRSQDAASLRARASELQRTYQELYRRKVAEVSNHIEQTRPCKQPYATDILLYAFEQSPTPTKRERERLVALTGMTAEQVRVWFQNRRQRMKKRAPEVQPRSALQLDDVLARVAAYRKAADEDFEDDDSGYCSGSDRGPPTTRASTALLTVPSTSSRSYPAPYTPRELSTEFHCDPPVFRRTAATHRPASTQATSVAELARLMSRMTLRHRRQTPRPSTGSAVGTASASGHPTKSSRATASVSSKPTPPSGDVHTRKKATRKDAETGRKVAGRRAASTAGPASPASSSSTSPSPASTTSSETIDAPAAPRKRLGALRRKPAGKALARQASGSSVASTSSSDSSRSTSYSSDFSLASDSSFTSVESMGASMDCFQPQQQPQFDPLAAFDFTQLFSSQPSDILPQPVADFELPPDLLAGLQMPMDTAALPPPESTDFLALLNDPTIQDLLQSVQDMDVVAPQQMQESLTFNNTLDVGSVDTSAFLDLSASTLPTFDAMFGLDASSFQDTLWNSTGFSLPITA